MLQNDGLHNILAHLHFFFFINLLKLVKTAPLDRAASTTVVVSVLMTLRVTNRPDTVTGDVNRGIQMSFATKVRRLSFNLVYNPQAGHRYAQISL